MGHGDIPKHVHVYRSKCKPLEFVMKGLKVAEKVLLSVHLAGGSDLGPIVEMTGNSSRFGI